jgi:methylaspartate ammonia-lyase
MMTQNMPKLDAKFYGTVIKAKDNTIVDAAEWCVFLAKDNAFANVLPMYLEECIKLGADQDQIDAVLRMITRLTDWRLLNPDRCKVPDAAGERLLG